MSSKAATVRADLERYNGSHVTCAFTLADRWRSRRAGTVKVTGAHVGCTAHLVAVADRLTKVPSIIAPPTSIAVQAAGKKSPS